jgi:hypothetical protein
MSPVWVNFAISQFQWQMPNSGVKLCQHAQWTPLTCMVHCILCLEKNSAALTHTSWPLWVFTIIKSTHFTCVLLLLLYPKLWPFITPWIVNRFSCNWCQKKEAQNFYNLGVGLFCVRVLLQGTITCWNLLLLFFLLFWFLFLFFILCPNFESVVSQKLLTGSLWNFNTLWHTLKRMAGEVFMLNNWMTLTLGQIQGHKLDP